MKCGFYSTNNFPRDIPVTDCIHVPTGAYAIVDLERDYKHRPRILASVGYIECVGVLACVKNAKGKPVRWGLAHLTVNNDAEKTIQRMDRELRAGLTQESVEYEVFGGNNDFGTFDFEANKLFNFITSRELLPNQVEDFLSAFNEITRSSITSKTLDRSNLIEAIRQQCAHQSSDELEGLLESVSNRLRDGNPLKEYKTRPEIFIYRLQTGKQLIDSTLKSVAALQGEGAYYDLTDDGHIGEDMIVDLATGKKYSEWGDRETQAIWMDRIQRYAPTRSSVGRFRDSLWNRSERAEEARTLCPAARMNWEKFVPETEERWDKYGWQITERRQRQKNAVTRY